MGSMSGALQNANNQMNQYAFNQQLGRGVSNQMYQPPRSDYDPYTASRRPNYMPYGPNQQFYQPIYQPSYSQFSPMGYGQAPFGGFYQPPMMGLGQRFGQRFGQPRFQQPQQQFDPNQAMHHGMFSGPMPRNMMPPGMFRPATDISDQGQADLRLRTPEGVSMHAPYDAPMLSPQPMQSQYRPIPFASQTTIDQVVSKARADGAADAAANQAAANASYGAAGGKVHEEGIDSLLKK
jgi:hypothetical protein